jgi:phosphohistidine phosphatase SixA
LRTVNPFAQFMMVRGLRPEDPPEWLRDELIAETRDVLLVGHMPHIARLSALLAPGSGTFPLHGMMAFERGDAGWTLVARADV